MNPSRWIAHVDMDSFYVSVERLKNPTLIDKPVVVGGRGRRGVVASASYEARKFGVRSAMPMSQAVRLHPALVIVEPDFESYSRISKSIFMSLEKISPVVEQVSVDEAYLDFTGCERIYSSREESAQKVQASVTAASGLKSTVAIATNKLIAKIGSDFAKPDGLLVVPAGSEQAFLRDLSVRKIPGIGPKTSVLFEARGIMTCGDLVKQDPRFLKQAFGDYALSHQEAAAGIDDSPVGEEGIRKSLSAEETFEYDVGDLDQLTDVAKQMSEEIATGLREESLKARTIGIKFRYADFTTLVRAMTLPEPTSVASDIYEAGVHLLKIHKDRNLKLRLFGLAARNLIRAADAPVSQLDLFQDPTKRIKQEKIENLKDDLRRKFGKKIIKSST